MDETGAPTSAFVARLWKQQHGAEGIEGPAHTGRPAIQRGLISTCALQLSLSYVNRDVRALVLTVRETHSSVSAVGMLPAGRRSSSQGASETSPSCGTSSWACSTGGLIRTDCRKHGLSFGLIWVRPGLFVGVHHSGNRLAAAMYELLRTAGCPTAKRVSGLTRSRVQISPPPH